jgi:flavin reductase (DIM6/NTAB) family NADH-FMN oxidoreductase RutF
MKTIIELSKKWMYYTFPKLTVLVSVEDKNQSSKPNIITIAWHSPVSLTPPEYGISVDPRRYSHDLIVEAGEFVVNFAGFELVDDMHFCGRRSGRKFDKFQDTNLTPEKAQKVNAPLIKECYAHLECKLVDHHVYGDHTWFVGEVVAVSADEDWFENGILKNGKMPIYYLGNNIYNSYGTDGPRVKK